MCIGLRVKYRLFCLILMKLEFCEQIFKKKKKMKNIKVHENLSSGRRVVSCERTGGRRADMTKLAVASCNFANAYKNT